MRYLIFIFLVINIISCTHYSDRIKIRADSSDFELIFTDQPPIFRIALINKSDQPICIQSETWPNVFGDVGFGSDYLSVEIGSRVYPIRDKNLGACAGCVIKIMPDEELVSDVPYINFEFPEELYVSEKTLNNTIAVFKC